MKELVKWLKENIGDSVQIITPQFERTKPLAFEWKPANEQEFYEIVNNAPWKILMGLGFGKWDSMNNIIKENIPKPIHEEFSIPIINKPGEEFVVDVGRGEAPIKLLEVDEDVILFPGEWYELIPDGFIVTGLNGEQYPFEKGKSDDDIRFGCLPYGIRRKQEAKS